MTRLRKGLAGVGIAAAILLLAEGLQYALWGPPPPPFQLARVSGTQLVVEGDTARLAHTIDARMDVLVPLAHESPRVLTLGGSSVRNPGPEGNNWPWQLQRLLPDVEVVNLASPGQTMGGLARLVEQIDALGPDLIVVYSGHNDMSQAVFTGRVGASGDWAIPVWKVLGLSWTAQHLSRPPKAELMDPNRRVALAFAENDRARELQPELHERYEEELRLLLARAPAPVVLTTLLRNFDQGPQGLLSEDEGCRALAGSVPVNTPDRPEERAVELEAACGETALGEWLKAHAQLAHGQPTKALEHWHRSLALDPYPLRATAETDAILRRVASDTGTPLVDLEAELGPFCRDDWFIDTLHPSAGGASAIAKALAPPVQGAL